MKYTFIFLALLGSLSIWRFTVSVADHGWSTHPVYYISAVAAIIVSLLLYRNLRGKHIGVSFRMAALLIAGILATMVRKDNYLPTAINDALLAQIIGSFFTWCLITAFALAIYSYIKRRLVNIELTEAEESFESINKGLVLFIIVMAALFAPFVIIAFLIHLAAG